MRVFRTGFFTSCRGCFPRNFRAPAVTPRSGCLGRKDRSCPSGSPKRLWGFRASPTTAPCAIPRDIGPHPMPSRFSYRWDRVIRPISRHSYARYRLCQGPALQQRQYPDRKRHPPRLDRQTHVPLLHHPGHQAASVRARVAVSMDLPHRFPDWGRGRDDAINLIKYSLIQFDRRRGTFGPADFPSIWNLKKYDSTPGDKRSSTLNLAGDTWDAYSVVMDSALGLLGAAPMKAGAYREVQWITDYAKHTPPPAYPFPIDTAKAADGQGRVRSQCAFCHAEDSGRVGRPLPLAKSAPTEAAWIAGAGTPPSGSTGRSRPWDRTPRPRRRGSLGYKVPHLDGIWLRAPYLHNGAVPSLRDLLKPPAERPPNSIAATMSTTRSTWASSRRDPRQRASGRYTTLAGKAMAMAGTFSARLCGLRKKKPCSSI